MSAPWCTRRALLLFASEQPISKGAHCSPARSRTPRAASHAHPTGHHVELRFGRDFHGLPIEFEIGKELGIQASHDVKRMGIAEYNKHCRGIVMRYASASSRGAAGGSTS